MGVGINESMAQGPLGYRLLAGRRSLLKDGDYILNTNRHLSMIQYTVTSVAPHIERVCYANWQKPDEFRGQPVFADERDRIKWNVFADFNWQTFHNCQIIYPDAGMRG